MKSLVFLCLLGVSLSYVVERHEEISHPGWQTWKVTHKKAYKDFDEEKVRFVIWKDNAQFIDESNAKNQHMKMGMNHFGDLTNTEFRSMMNGYRMHNNTGASTFMAPAHLKAPDSVDWR